MTFLFKMPTMTTEQELEKQFQEKYTKQVDEVLAKAVEEATAYLGQKVYVQMWYQSSRFYIRNNFVLSLSHVPSNLDDKQVDFRVVKFFINCYVNSHTEFLKNLVKKENRFTIKEIAETNDVDIKELEAIIQKATGKELDTKTDYKIKVKS